VEGKGGERKNGFGLWTQGRNRREVGGNQVKKGMRGEKGTSAAGEKIAVRPRKRRGGEEYPRD